MRQSFLRPNYFIWIIVPIAVYLTYLALGLPHFIWSYSFLDNGQRYDPFAERYYTQLHVHRTVWFIHQMCLQRTL